MNAAAQTRHYVFIMKEIEDIAIKFRNVILSTEKDSRPIGLQDFPNGSCGDASRLLGTYLEEKGFGKFFVVSGERGSKQDNKWKSHTWLKNDALIVDITADQFDEIKSAVIVAEKSFFHDTFEIVGTSYSNFWPTDKHCGAPLRPFYLVLKDLMECN